jgi:hypothetical protein
MSALSKIKYKLCLMEEDWRYPNCRAADAPKLRNALVNAVEFIQWLRAKGVILSSSSSMSEECLEKILKNLNEI